MVGHLQFQGMENNSKEKNRESLLDSPDSGLPPSPSPPFYSLSPGIAENKAVDKNPCAEILDHGPGKDGQERKVIPYVFLNSYASEIRPRMYPVCNSEIKYSSEKHYRDDIFYHPRPTITTYRESVTVAPNCTWRNYKSQLLFEPRQKPLRFQSTTIIFPKRAKNLYRTTLNYRLGCAKRWFASSVQLALCEDNETYLMHPENLS
ncbi:hypothetical protein Chor_000005 [Crotalus horridus]